MIKAEEIVACCSLQQMSALWIICCVMSNRWLPGLIAKSRCGCCCLKHAERPTAWLLSNASRAAGADTQGGHAEVLYGMQILSGIQPAIILTEFWCALLLLAVLAACHAVALWCCHALRLQCQASTMGHRARVRKRSHADASINVQAAYQMGGLLAILSLYVKLTKLYFEQSVALPFHKSLIKHPPPACSLTEP